MLESGTMTLAKSLVRPNEEFAVTFAGWTDDDSPLTYQIRLDRQPLGAFGTGNVITFSTPPSDGPHEIEGLISDALGNKRNVSATFTVDGTPPAISMPDTLTFPASSAAGAVGTFGVTATDALDPAPHITVTPPSGSVFPIGSTMVEVRAEDWLGNVSTGYFWVLVPPGYVDAQVVASAGKLAGNLIGSPLDGDNGYRLYSLGVPTISSQRHILTTGTARHSYSGSAPYGISGKTLTGVLLGYPFGDGIVWTMPLRKDGPADAVAPGLKWRTFPREPFMDYSDGLPVRFGFYARVVGPGVTARNDDVLCFYKQSEDEYPQITTIAREGDEAPGVPGGRFKSFTAAAMAARTVTFGVLPANQSVMFTAMLETGPQGTQGPGGVDSTNDMGLWVWEHDALTLALREGQALNGRVVRSFEALRGPVGHGHAVSSDGESYHQNATAGGFTTSVLIKFADGGRRLSVAGSLGTTKLVDENTTAAWVDAGLTYGLGIYVPWGRFVSSSRDPSGHALLTTTVTDRPASTNTVVVVEKFDADAMLLLSKGDTVQDGSVLTSLSSPLISGNWTLAVLGKTNTGINGGWYGGGSEFFRVNGPAPGAGGGNWRNLQSYALPDEMGPLFTANLRAGSARVPAPGGVTSANDAGLWAVDSRGVTHLLIREGGTIGGITVKRFKALTSVAGSPGQARSFNGYGDVIVWVMAPDLTQHLVRFAIP